MGKFNKATAAAIATAITTIVGTMGFNLTPEFLTAANVVIVTILVWLVPNREA